MRCVALGVCLAAGTVLFGARPLQRPTKLAPPLPVAALLAQAQARLAAGRDPLAVLTLDVVGTETRTNGPRPKVDPYEFRILFPDSFQLRSGPVLHWSVRGVYGRRLLDAERYGGPLVDRMLSDPESQKTAAQTMPFHLMRISLGYLARLPPTIPAAEEDLGLRDFTRVKGRTIGFRYQGLQVELVLDPLTAQPLATVCHGRITGGAGAPAGDNWISVFGDYGEVAGVRFPHSIDEWIGANHSRVVVTRIRVNALHAEDFVVSTPQAR